MLDFEVVLLSGEVGGEMTNHFTVAPFWAAWTAVTSPIPPAGEMTRRVFGLEESLLLLLLVEKSCVEVHLRDESGSGRRNELGEEVEMVVVVVAG